MAIKSGYEAELYTMLEFVGAGVSVIDFNLDGLQDLVFGGGGGFGEGPSIHGAACKFYRAESKFRFADVSSKALLDGSKFYNHGVFVEDIDADGFEDLLITGFGGVQLYLNQGDGTFALADESLTPNDPHWSTAACFGDVNADGLVDLYLAHYGNWSLENNPYCFGKVNGVPVRKTCAPESFLGIDDSLFVLDANGSFDDVSKEMGLVPQGRGLGIVSADFDMDGDVDFYVANDESENFLYLNQNGKNLLERGIQNGCAVDGNGQVQGSMGIAIGDLQGDMIADLFVTNFSNEISAFYSGRSRGSFRFQSPQVGIKLLGPSQVSWGTVLQDFDRDGDDDLMIVSGHVDRTNDYYKQRPTLMENQAARFIDRTDVAGSYFVESWASRALAIFDHDVDGNMDCVVTHLDETSHVLRNATKSDGRYLYVRLIGTKSNRNALGAVVKSKDSKGNEQFKHRYGGGSYLATAEKVLTFTSPSNSDADRTDLTITWPSGIVSTIEGLSWNQSISIVEPNVEGQNATWFQN